MPASERNLLLQALLVTCATLAALRLAGGPRTQLWLRQWASRSAVPAPPDAMGLFRSISKAQRTVRRSCGIEGTCLVRSLALWALLKKHGVEAEIRIGLRKREGSLEGHAWVEFDGVAMNEDGAEAGSYKPYAGRIDFDRWL